MQRRSVPAVEIHCDHFPELGPNSHALLALPRGGLRLLSPRGGVRLRSGDAPVNRLAKQTARRLSRGTVALPPAAV
jgi:hypothetical protein